MRERGERGKVRKEIQPLGEQIQEYNQAADDTERPRAEICFAVELPMQAVTAGCNCLKSRETEGSTTDSVCVCVCVCVQDKWVPGTFSVWECSFPPCSLTQSLVLAAAKAQHSGNLAYVVLFLCTSGSK